MSGMFQYSFPPDDLYLLITVLLIEYDAEKKFLNVAKSEQEKEDARNGMRIIGQAVKILVSDFHKSKRFMLSLKEFCKVHSFDIEPIVLVSDIVGDKHDAPTHNASMH